MKRIANNSFFLPYQVKWIRDNSRLKIMEKSRQIGISLAAAYSVVRRHMSGMGYYDTWISSRDDLQAMLFLDDCKKFAKIIEWPHIILLYHNSLFFAIILQFN